MSKRATGSSRRYTSRARARSPARHGLVELDALARREHADAGDPAGRAGGEALERPVVAADEHLEVAVEVQQRGDPARVARALLDGDDAVDLVVDARDQRRRAGRRREASGLL